MTLCQYLVFVQFFWQIILFLNLLKKFLEFAEMLWQLDYSSFEMRQIHDCCCQLSSIIGIVHVCKLFLIPCTLFNLITSFYKDMCMWNYCIYSYVWMSSAWCCIRKTWDILSFSVQEKKSRVIITFFRFGWQTQWDFPVSQMLQSNEPEYFVGNNFFPHKRNLLLVIIDNTRNFFPVINSTKDCLQPFPV